MKKAIKKRKTREWVIIANKKDFKFVDRLTGHEINNLILINIDSIGEGLLKESRMTFLVTGEIKTLTRWRPTKNKKRK